MCIYTYIYIFIYLFIAISYYYYHRISADLKRRVVTAYILVGLYRKK